jgi:Zn-dependent protease with chaperone function
MATLGRFSSSIVPPWLWIWLIVFLVLMLPYYVAVWVRNIQELFHIPVNGLDWATDFSMRILGLVGLLELVPSLALFLGILALLWPRQRTRRLEESYKLKPAAPTSPAMTEILEFIHHHAPGIEVRVNRLRFDQTPFVYPLGFRKTAIAIFGQLVKLWQADRPAAEAILLHELAHYRHGDTLIIGAGSPFRAVVECWGKLYTGLFLAPFLLSFFAITVLFFGEIVYLMSIGGGGIGLLFRAVAHKLGQSFFMLFGALFIGAGLLIFSASVFIVPMVAIWCSELNADQAPASRSPQATLNALQRLPEKARGRQWLLYRLAHPPGKLRLWMVKNSTNLLGKVALLLLFPLSFILQAWLLRLLRVMGEVNGIKIVPIDRVASPQMISFLWVIAGALLALWPFLSPRWEQVFCSSQPSKATESLLPYWVSAGLLAGLGLWGMS